MQNAFFAVKLFIITVLLTVPPFVEAMHKDGKCSINILSKQQLSDLQKNQLQLLGMLQEGSVEIDSRMEEWKRLMPASVISGGQFSLEELYALSESNKESLDEEGRSELAAFELALMNDTNEESFGDLFALDQPVEEKNPFANLFEL